jgi:hypothetical protein
MTEEQVAREARILTPSAKHLLLTGEDKSAFGFAGAALILRGLMDYRLKWWLFGPQVMVPTRFGKRVRAHLTKEQTDAG